MRGAIPPLPNTPSWRGAQLKHGPRSTKNKNTLEIRILRPVQALHHPFREDKKEKTTLAHIQIKDEEQNGEKNPSY
jgi:hypothetical protein